VGLHESGRGRELNAHILVILLKNNKINFFSLNIISERLNKFLLCNISSSTSNGKFYGIKFVLGSFAQ
jgi:hypothetical protein